MYFVRMIFILFYYKNALGSIFDRERRLLICRLHKHKKGSTKARKANDTAEVQGTDVNPNEGTFTEYFLLYYLNVSFEISEDLAHLFKACEGIGMPFNDLHHFTDLSLIDNTY